MDINSEYGYMFRRDDINQSIGFTWNGASSTRAAGSFVQNENKNVTGEYLPTSDLCTQYAPLMFLLGNDECSTPQNSPKGNEAWLEALTWECNTGRTFNNAAFLANQIIYSQLDTETDSRNGLSTYSDEGTDVSKPKISTASVTGISVLLGLYLFSLLVLSAWASVKIGYVKRELDDRDLHDLLPGFVGDDEPDMLVGKVAVGAMAPLWWRRKYWRVEGLSV
ncbi:hypothetical protein ASPWEDRAFT_184573 [Aspergillus wentii DTO 134E9]|uniref:Uncharacterized protein n=1 Tax=Aspergillus wentii DTO 134E9 TaxID=1073089 RepID=A0A1L9RGQ4_ASPWE|nr:uncharacterized protein ASPWEDRAFT_184573 [Aspergillus wentii DTO 134E9]OJJ34033.1 hypothetical protein ASPWEDRAFT_184573 [Aspergillus wentii DTO 134E9]